MRVVGDSLVLAPSDLSGFLSCRHRTGLDVAVAYGVLHKPERTDPLVGLLRQRGAEHEARYVEWLRSTGLNVVNLTMDDEPERTMEAMRTGVDAIVQANLAAAGWSAFVDVLRRVESPSQHWPWSYEPFDTKLAHDTRGATIVQLCVYAELLEGLQGVRPEYFHVVTPGELAVTDGRPFVEHRYRWADFAAFYRTVRAKFFETIAQPHDQLIASSYPEPVELCEVCYWWDRCNDRRRADDHLSFVAGIRRLQRAELTTQGIPTLAAAAAMAIPITFTPKRGSKETYAVVREQARLQNEQRTTGAPHWMLLPIQDDAAVAEQGPSGLRRLPAPSSHDLFLDLEGARFAREGGREYLFGLWRLDRAEPSATPAYTSFWATTDVEERVAFEAIVDLIMEAWRADPGMHVYHFGHYEPSAFKRLMGRHATRADEVDRLLRAGGFVDLHTIVRQALRAGIESYSIKQLEQYYNFARDVSLQDASLHLRAVELALETASASAIGDDVREAVCGYNRDDCRSTHALRDWLETIRADVEASGTSVARPALEEGDASLRVTALQAEVDDLRARLLDGVLDDTSERDEIARARWLLAYLIDWHRRADKAEWWEFFRLCELPEADLIDERKAVAGLEFVKTIDRKVSKKGRLTGTVTDRYNYPEQDIEIYAGDELKLQDRTTRLGTVRSSDRFARTIDVEKGPSVAALHPRAAFVHKYIDPAEMQRAIMRLARELLGAELDVPRGAGFDLLFRRAPSFGFRHLEREPGESSVAHAIRLVLDLDKTTLAIQGPPGAGKTYTGAQMIRVLVAAGKRVGVTANSHTVIRNLLNEVRRQATADNPSVRLGHKVPDEGSSRANDGTADICEFTDNVSARGALHDREIDVLGGTPFLWAREEFANSVDVLFVDEAGQMSLANALAVSQSAENLILLGDPQQLEQPQKGAHPDGVSVSALEHVLGGAETMPDDRGLFLTTTWRLAPTINQFTSEVFYEGRLSPKAGLERQALVGAGVFEGAGLWLVLVDHEGNQTSSAEEASCVHSIVTRLLAGARWVNEHAEEAPLQPNDFRVVAPYNAQVNRLTERLAEQEVPVGTVDKFQGQEAPVVIYSMATSRPEDAPRGMEFLYSLNRLNVATSRARCAVIVVASPKLFEPECRTPRQMHLANALCRYREMARILTCEQVRALSSG